MNVFPEGDSVLTDAAVATARDARSVRPLPEWPFGGERPPTASLSGQNILLAFDGSTESEAAARVAAAIGDTLHAPVNVVSIIDSTPIPIPFPLDIAIGIAGESGGGAIHDEQEREVGKRISTLLARPVEWPTAIELGVPADAIVRRASRIGAALVVMGLRRHGVVDRVVNDETSLSVMRRAAGPVLGVAAGATGLPRRALVAMDFSRASVQAAIAAAQLMADGGVLTLAYVESMLAYPAESSEGVIHTLGLNSAFACVERALASAALGVDHVVLHHSEAGALSRFLLEYAKEIRADLLVAGSARHGRLDRILLGSMSAELVRDGQYSTLVVPPVHE
ncbi:MAG: universal stress protein [Gemmatimonadaceae bacterium]